MRRVAAQGPALPQRLQHQRDVALLQVAHTAVNQLGAAARSALGEVVGLEQRGAVAATGRVDGAAEARRAAADHEDLELLGPQPFQHARAVHGAGRLAGRLGRSRAGEACTSLLAGFIMHPCCQSPGRGIMGIP